VGRRERGAAGTWGDLTRYVLLDVSEGPVDLHSGWQMEAASLFSCTALADTTRFCSGTDAACTVRLCSGTDAACTVRLCSAQIPMWPERDSVWRSIELELQVCQQVWSWDDTNLGRLRVSRLSNRTLSELTDNWKTAVVWDLWFSLW